MLESFCGISSDALRQEGMRGSRGIAPLILNLETIKLNGQPHALAALPSMEALELVWTLWNGENLLTPSGIESGND